MLFRSTKLYDANCSIPIRPNKNLLVGLRYTTKYR